MSKKRGVYILGYKRTPFGKFFGALKDFSAPALAGAAIGTLFENKKTLRTDGVILGNVFSAGLGLAPARRAALLGGQPESVSAHCVDEACSSSLTAVESASEKIQLGKAGLMIAGGMESMSRTPYLIPRPDKKILSGWSHRYGRIFDGGSRLVIDSMIYDGLLEIIIPLWKKMGELADDCARAHDISRGAQEAYAHESFLRAHEAQKAGKFSKQIVAIRSVFADEGIREPDIDKMRSLPPVFGENGTVTAATSAQISDGATALLLGDSRIARNLGLSPLARIVDFADNLQSPALYTTAPVGAIQQLLRQNNLKISDISIFEINEASSVVPLYAMRKLNIPHERMNIWGGAIAIGHPLGASGGRLLMNAIEQINENNGRYAVVCTCHGGGGAVAVLIENTLN